MNTKIQIVSTDMDGTVLDADGVVPEENVVAIRRLLESGKHFVVNTGRTPEDATAPFETHGIRCAKSCYNGALVLDAENNVIAKEVVSKKSLVKAIEILEETNCYFIIFTSKGAFTHHYFSQEDRYSNISDELHSLKPRYVKLCEKRIAKKTLVEVENFDAVINDDEVEIYKLGMLSGSSELLEATKLELMEKAGLIAATSDQYYLEINDKNATKGKALKIFVDTLGLTLENAMAIGDGYNDASMFEVAGLSVAMGNSPDGIKAMCDQVTESHINYGWANAVEKFVLECDFYASVD